MRSLLRFPMLALFALVVAATTGYAEAASCAQGVKSKNSNTPVTVKFINKSGEYRSVMWVDFKGRYVSYANLNPGQSYSVSTFVTHPWIFTDGPGNCVEMFMPKKGVKRFNITVKSTGEGGD
jgi:uncharacterized protein YegP (UPF0339 family)